ncbi:hypothetical protein [Saccharomonospora halophila]|uniref:hypothetical protein n=1 Tax=Saccharomonospora halophila TaxID=129922 RepID=UPI00036AB0BB|nr:hypothetical protein [Saccharomonospora halophila]
MWDDDELAERLSTLDQLLAGLADRADDAAGATVQTLADVYGEALERIVRAADDTVVAALADDPLVGHLLLAHDLHPHDPGTRIRAVLADAAPDVRAELDGLVDGVASVTVTDGSDELAGTVTDLVRAVAPEVTEVRIDHRSEPAFVPLTAVRAR